MWTKPTFQRKTKIVCTIGPSSASREMIWKLAETGMNVARLNMSHGDHNSHKKVIDLVKEYNAQSPENVIAIMLDTKVKILFVSMCGCAHTWYVNICIDIFPPPPPAHTHILIYIGMLYTCVCLCAHVRMCM